jgi:hypothetical protein
MGLFDSYLDPDQFQDSGGLLGRLLSLQPQQDHRPSLGFDLQSPTDGLHDLNAQYQALRPVLGDGNAMLAVVHPEARQALIAEVLARRKNTGNSGDTNSAENGQLTTPVETSKNCQCGGCAAHTKN